MKYVVFAVILGVAGLIGFQVYLTVTGQDCPNGRVVTSLETCRAVQGFDAAFCGRVFAETDRVMRQGGTVYATPNACQRRPDIVCVQSRDPVGWVERPEGFCVARANDGGIARMTPVYAGHANRGG